MTVLRSLSWLHKPRFDTQRTTRYVYSVHTSDSPANGQCEDDNPVEVSFYVPPN